MSQPSTTTTTTSTTAPIEPTIASVADPQAVQISSGSQNTQIANATGWAVDDAGNLNILNGDNALVGTFATGQWDSVQIVG